MNNFKGIEFIRKFLTVAVMSAIILLAGCSGSQKNSGDHKNNQKNDTVRVSSKYARGFSIDHHKQYKLLNIHPLGRQDTFRYLLKNGETEVNSRDYDRVINVPVKTFASTATTNIGMAGKLNVLSALSGLSLPTQAYNKQVRKNVENGKIVNIGNPENLNKEQIINLDPGILLTFNISNVANEDYKMLDKAGVPVIPFAGWKEQHPLARAEWIKAMSVFFGKSRKADSIFNKIESSYLETKSQLPDTVNQPVVIFNIPFKGQWFMPSGNSYMAQLLYDAGGDFPWKDWEKAGSLNLAFEKVYEEGLNADYWFINRDINSIEEMVSMDERFSEFKPARTGNVYNFANKVSDNGANDYWESGYINPDTVLKDFMKIMHPDLLPEHKLVYMKKLKE